MYDLHGEHSNSVILRKYGHVEENESKYDFSEVPLTTLEKLIYIEFERITFTNDILKQIYDIIKENNIVQES